MKLTLNIHGSIAKYYRLFYRTTELPNNLCVYVNGVFFSVFVIILTAIIFVLLVGINIIVKHIKHILNSKTGPTYEELQKTEALKELKELRKQKTILCLTKKMFISWKEKHCPIIEWKDGK